MLGLAEQVGGDDPRIGRLVRDDQDLGRAGDEVDPDLPEEPSLRLDDICVARTDEDSTGSTVAVPTPCRERLHAAEDVDLVRAGEVHRGDGGVGDASVERRCARGDASTPATFAVTMLMWADATIG